MDFAWLLFGLLATSVFVDFVELVSDNEPDPPVAPTIPGAGGNSNGDLLFDDSVGDDTDDPDAVETGDLAVMDEEASYDELSDTTYGNEGFEQNAQVVDVQDTTDRIEAEAESEAIWVGLDGNALANPAEVDDFQTGEDILYVALETEMFEGPVDIEVVQSQDAQDGMIFVCDELIAILKDAPNASASDIYVKMTRLVA